MVTPCVVVYVVQKGKRCSNQPDGSFGRPGIESANLMDTGSHSRCCGSLMDWDRQPIKPLLDV
jgi:hypothetical protein